MLKAAARKPRPSRQPETETVGRGPAMRLLPVVIIAALSMLGFRIQVVVQSIADKPQASVAISQSSALAQAQSEPQQEEAMPEPVPADDAMAMPPDESSDMATPASEPMAINPSELTSSEIETLQRLAERREYIVRREQELQQKESLVMAAERRLDQKITQMQDIESELKALVEQYDAKKNSEIEQLVRIYTAMKPKDAARIFDNLDMTILVSVVTNMKENKVAPILSLMEAEKARQLTEEMSSRRNFPGMSPAGQSG